MADKKTSAKKSAGESKTIQIEYYRSAICTPDKHRKVVKGLGFHAAAAGGRCAKIRLPCAAW